MSLEGLLVHDVTILTPGTTVDRYGNTVDDWTAPATALVKGWVAQRSRSEDNDGRQAEVSDWAAFFSEGTVVASRCRVRWENPSPPVLFDVDGPPNRAWTPGGEHHVEVQLRVIVG